MLRKAGGVQWVRPFTRRLQHLFGWGAAVEKACRQHDTKKLAKLLPGAHAVDPALLPAIVQLGDKPKLQMLEDCPHCMWWDQKQELLNDYEGKKTWRASLTACTSRFAFATSLRLARRNPVRTGGWSRPSGSAGRHGGARVFQ